jgi:hypothetical protein
MIAKVYQGILEAGPHDHLARIDRFRESKKWQALTDVQPQSSKDLTASSAPVLPELRRRVPAGK